MEPRKGSRLGHRLAVSDERDRASSELDLKRKCPFPYPSNVIRLEVTNQGGIAMSQFVYLYRGAERGRSPEKMQEMMQKWMTWMKQLTDKGYIKDPGQPLEHTGKLVKGKQKTVTDGPFAETKDVVGGYTLIEANDLEQAVELSKGCPIFEVDGAVEVRPVMKMSM
jgi:hypothetical protein